MGKKVVQVNAMQSTMFDIPVANTVIASSSKQKKSGVSLSEIDMTKIGINHGDFGKYISKGRGNNLNWENDISRK